MTSRSFAVAATLLLLSSTVQAAPPPHLVILTPTGQTRDGLQVLTRHPDATHVGRVLTQGFSGHLLRLYAMEQEFLRQKTGRVPEPAYLLLSNRQGGFPQFGFYLNDEKKPDAGWVDLHRTSTLSGRFGAMDQIFPHELLHIIVRQLAGEPRKSGSNQVHAIGVRTDPANAFSEGFAEHVQILAIDDPNAVPETQALLADAAIRTRASDEVSAFARGLAYSWWPVQPSRLRFLLWFSQTEQVLRYDAVKANLFAHAPSIPTALLTVEDKYLAYLYQSVVPGSPEAPAKPAGVMLSTEGVIAHLFWRFVTDPELQRQYLDNTFYAQFGVTADDVTPLENVFLKLFAALADGRPSTAAELLRTYVRVFPHDAPHAERVVRAALLGQTLPDAPEIWLANDHLMTGTSLFDQFRGAPRPHTFDVNASTVLDWLAVTGVTPELATRLVTQAPYADLAALLRTPGLPDPTRDRVAAMSAAMTTLLAKAAQEEDQISLWAIARAYLWRLSAVILAATMAGAWLARRAGVRHRWSASLVGLAATLTVLAFAWIITCPPWYPLAAPLVVFGLPLAFWRLVKQRSLRPSLKALLIWALAAGPALVLMRAW